MPDKKPKFEPFTKEEKDEANELVEEVFGPDTDTAHGIAAMKLRISVAEQRLATIARLLPRTKDDAEATRLRVERKGLQGRLRLARKRLAEYHGLHAHNN